MIKYISIRSILYVQVGAKRVRHKILQKPKIREKRKIEELYSHINACNFHLHISPVYAESIAILRELYVTLYKHARPYFHQQNDQNFTSQCDRAAR